MAYYFPLIFDLSLVKRGHSRERIYNTMKLPSAFLVVVVALGWTSASWTEAWSGCGPGGGYSVMIRPGGRLETRTILSPELIPRRRHRHRHREHPRELLRRQQQKQLELWDRSSNPTIQLVQYQIRDTDLEFMVALDVPGVLAEDIDVALENDSQVLAISGEREKLGEHGSTYRVPFAQKFFLEDETIDIDKFSASLKNGVLVVTAPKRVSERTRKIPVVSEEEEEQFIGDASSSSVSNVSLKQDQENLEDTNDGIAPNDSTISDEDPIDK